MTKKGFTTVKAVHSAALKRISHSSDDNTLLVEYSSGESWYYDNVPKAVYGELLECEKNGTSVGKVFINLVKNNPNRPGRKMK